MIKRRYTSNAVAYEDAVLSFPTPFLHTPAVGDYPDGTPVGSDGPLWTRFAAARDPVEDGLEYVQGDRTPWIPRGSGVFDNASKAFTGEWDAGMVRSRKSSRVRCQALTYVTAGFCVPRLCAAPLAAAAQALPTPRRSDGADPRRLACGLR